MPVHGFTPSLHQLSVLQGVMASVNRTPHKIAIEENGHCLTYEDLHAAIIATDVFGHMKGWPTERTKVIVQWLASAHASGAAFNEDRIFIEQPQPLSERVIVLRLLSAAVSHGAFSRDIVSGVPLPLSEWTGVVAALLPLWLGGTLHLFDPGSIALIADAVGAGRVNQIWLGQAEFDVLSLNADNLPLPAPSFRLAVCNGMPADSAASTLTGWLGSERITAETRTEELGALRRHPGLAREGEPYIGVIFSKTGMVSSLTAIPSVPVWRSA